MRRVQIGGCSIIGINSADLLQAVVEGDDELILREAAPFIASIPVRDLVERIEESFVVTEHPSTGRKSHTR
jgi:hypothetical protein